MASAKFSPSRHFGRQHPVRLTQGTRARRGPTAAPEPEPDVPSRTSITPRHPIPSMQGAFDESLAEHTNGSGVSKPSLRSGDARARREALLSQPKDDGPPLEHWRARPGQTNHELRRLIAQISFGVHLLLRGSATAVDSVVQILQGHIDEVDEFLETALEDIALATEDLRGRLSHLKLPMANMEVFEKMLEDRGYRLQVLDGNEIIEHVVSRSTTALTQTARDVSEGLGATQVFMEYLAGQQEGSWRADQPGVESIYEAMKGNAEGWHNALVDLQAKAKGVRALTLQLNGVISEIELMAGEVSRRTRFTAQPFKGPAHTPSSSRSSITTSMAESPPRIPDTPPRLSLRLSSIVDSKEDGSTYFSILPEDKGSPSPTQSQSNEPLGAVDDLEPLEIRVGLEVLAQPDVDQPPQMEGPDVGKDDNDDADDDDAHNPLYILQPRTYTPQTRESLPSPRIQVTAPESGGELAGTKRKSLVERRASLRQRMSLKTNPPESIQIPPPDAPELQRPDAESPQFDLGPDSAYGSDVERPAVTRMAPGNLSTSDLSRPVFSRPDVVPSPQSDQHFRPVQASPYSPLQQRPHTSHTMARHATYQQQPKRSIPSAMGTSMLNNVTNASNDGGSMRTLKKKRSAFGWLKKAFALDEEERATFEQRRQQTSPNLYYDRRSPQFLDGRRVK